MVLTEDNKTIGGAPISVQRGQREKFFPLDPEPLTEFVVFKTYSNNAYIRVNSFEVYQIQNSFTELSYL